MGKLAVAAITSLWVIPMSIIVNHIVPEPYMVKKNLFRTWVPLSLWFCVDYCICWILQDEIFHVPQAQQYCNGNFRSWDPM